MPVSFTLEYWDIPTGRGPYWIGPFHTLTEAQHAAGGHEAVGSKQLYLVRRGLLPGNNHVVSACLNGKWFDSPSRRGWWENLPERARLRLQEAPDRPLTGRQVIEIVLAGGTAVGALSAAGTPASYLARIDQSNLQQPNPTTAPPQPMTLAGESSSSTIGWVATIATVAAAAVLAAILHHRAYK